MRKKVFVGLSGGVDSAVSAALLQREGHDVVGAFIKIWQPQFIECTWREDRLDAMRVCAALGIPFREIDLSAEYEREVVRDMLENYSAGRTPNPDVLCNRSIKFGHFSKWAFEQGADYVATGHYARVEYADSGFELRRGTDENKDQSYFLHRLSQADLARVLFPIGSLEKTRVRSLAHELDLPVAAKPDSQGLCFVGDITMKTFLGRFLELREGDVIDESGAVIGRHDGAALYTIGERHGFDAHGGPARFITRIDTTRNEIFVSSRKDDALTRTISLSDTHWIETMPKLPARLAVQTRYRETPCEADVARKSGAITVTLSERRVASPGQSLVFYDGPKCLGGGFINTLRGA